MNVAIVGLGLIGGSLCKAFSLRTDHSVWGLDLDAQVARQAVEQRAIDQAIQPEQLQLADFTFLCVYPHQTLEFLKRFGRFLKKGSIVCDVCGVKLSVVSQAERLLGQDVHFVGLHPMAGREYSGFAYSKADLFEGASLVVCQTPATCSEAVEIVERLAGELGFSNIVHTDPKTHDEIIAFTSQLAHVVSNAYIKSPTALKTDGFTGGSFQDLTRVALLSAPMWAELFLLNRAPLLKELEGLIGHLSEYAQALRDNDEQMLRQLLEEGSRLKEKSLRVGNDF